MTQPTTTPTNPTVKVSRDLAEIVDLSTQLLGQAVHDANAQIDGTSLPGGRAMIALAGVGDTATFERRVETTERAWFQWHQDDQVKLVDGYCVIPDDGTRPDPAADEDDDTAPALQILRFWSEQYRWQVGAVWDHIPTINTEAKFLRHQLNWIAEHDAAQWAHFARDINRARRHLETIVHAGHRPDRSRVVCNNPTCEAPKPLIRTYGDDVTGADDRWKCTACKARYDADAFRRAHAQQLRHESAARYVLLPEAIATLKVQGRAERTIRKWLEPPLKYEDQCTRCRGRWPHQEHAACPRKLTDRAGQPTGEECGGDLAEVTRGNAEAVVEAWCDTSTHQTWVWWPDLWRLHLITTTRRRQA